MASSERAWVPVAVPSDVPAPAGAYSPAVRAGDLIFVSGQVPVDARTRALIGEDVATQTRAVLANVERVLGYAGAALADVISVTVYLADIGEWDAFNAVYREAFRPPYPTRTTVGAALHGFLVEISAVACRPVSHG
ncbi:MAG: RidA family protein [Gemmatimonadetes bacterium]|nr:RidA family protein [Gemmatimonadota bacterium]